MKLHTQTLPILFIGCLLIPVCSLSQSSKAFINANTGTLSSSQELTVGNTVPDITIDNIINYKSSSANFRSLRGKWVLIDFWGRTCSSCISALPNFNTVRKEFPNLEVITVSDLQSKQEVTQTLARFRRTAGLELPTVVNNNILKKYFPHEIISHVIWIDPNGVIQAITGAEYVTAKNVRAIMNGKVDWPIKKDVFEFDYDKPLLSITTNSYDKPIANVYYSAFTGYIDGLGGGSKRIIDSINNTLTINHFNKPLLQYCALSMVGISSGPFDSKHIILNVDNVDRFSSDKQVLNASRNKYCYSLTLPLSTSPKKEQEFIRSDIERWLNLLNITVKGERRYISCLVLVRTDVNDNLVRTKGGASENLLSDPGPIKQLKNLSFSHLMWQLNHETVDIPLVIDETGIPKDMKVDLRFEIKSFNDIYALRTALKPYGLDLIDATREVNVYVISDKNR